MENLKVTRQEGRYIRDTARVITRPYIPGDAGRIKILIDRVLNMSEGDVNSTLDYVMSHYSYRHRDLVRICDNNFKRIRCLIPKEADITEKQRLLLGAYCTMEYSIESAGLFNPSIVLHPDQDDLEEGTIRFVMSLRAVGEGHISSIEFRSGKIDEEINISLDPVSRFVDTPEVQLNPMYDKRLFMLKLHELGADNEVTDYLFSRLPAQFTYEQGKKELKSILENKLFPEHLMNKTVENILWIAKSNYEMKFNRNRSISERVIFPVSENESMGLEDARFVRFVDDDGSVTYYATYTAFNGRDILPQMIETRDFVTFRVLTLNGKAVQNKGMALFPRRIDGKFVMAARQDGVNNHIMFSDEIHFWHESIIIQEPHLPWEFVQIGNCGSPIETEEGWLLLTHGVGPMRQYSMGAILLDLDDPTRLIKRLFEPLLTPNEEERNGYVPNVVYTCGAIVHNGVLIIPYGMSDIRTGFATVPLVDLLEAMEPV